MGSVFATPVTTAPPGWPNDKHPGDIIASAGINEIRDTVYQWPGDVNGNGNSLQYVRSILINAPANAGTIFAFRDASSGQYKLSIDAVGALYTVSGLHVNSADGTRGVWSVDNTGTIHFPDGTTQNTASVGGGQPQTPWASDIDGGGHSLAGVNNVTATRLLAYPKPGDYGLHIRAHDDSNWDWITDTEGNLYSYTAKGLICGSVTASSYVAVINQKDSTSDVLLYDSQMQMTSRAVLQWTPSLSVWDVPDIVIFRESAGSLGIKNPTTSLWSNVHLGSVTYPDGSVQTTAYTGQAGGGGQAQTPWLSNIDANRHQLTNATLVSIFPADAGVAFGVLKTDGSKWHWFIDGTGIMSSQTDSLITNIGGVRLTLNGVSHAALEAAWGGLRLNSSMTVQWSKTANWSDNGAIKLKALYPGWNAAPNDGTLVVENRITLAGFNGYGDVFYIWNQNVGHTARIDIDGNAVFNGNLTVVSNISVNGAVDVLSYIRGSSYYVQSENRQVIDGNGTFVGLGMTTSGNVIVNSPGNLLLRNNAIYFQSTAGETRGHINWLGDAYMNTYNLWTANAPGIQVINPAGIFNGSGVDVAGGTVYAGNVFGRNQVAVQDLTSGLGQIHIALYDRRLSMSNVGTINWNPDGTYYSQGDIRLGRYDASALYISDPSTNARKSLFLWNLVVESGVSFQDVWFRRYSEVGAESLLLERNSGGGGSLAVGDLNAFRSVHAGTDISASGTVTCASFSAGGDASARRLVAYTSSDYAFLISANNAGASSWNWLIGVDGGFYSPNDCAFRAGTVTANGGFGAFGSVGLGIGADQFTFRDHDGRTIWVRGGIIVSVT